MRYDDARAVVTGGASGIGRATARRLVREGATVAVLDLDLSGAEEVADSIAGFASHLDLADVDAIPRAASNLIHHLGAVDLLVNCAGWDRAKPFHATGPDFWRKVIDINLVGAIALTHALLPSMPDGSAIVNVSSDAGRVGLQR